MKLSELYGHVADALEVEPGSVGPDSSSENIEEWDSLGHITVLGMLDELTNGASTNIVDLTQATSMSEIIQLLNDHGLLDK
jgi:hypothetical protein